MTVRPWPKTLEGLPPRDGGPSVACFYYVGLKKKQVSLVTLQVHTGPATRSLHRSSQMRLLLQPPPG